MASCIEHNKFQDRHGYGQHKYYDRSTGKRRTTTLHRYVWALNAGMEIEDVGNRVIRHTCDNPKCINPQHLIEGTTADNMRDKVLRGRQPRGALVASSKLTDAEAEEVRQYALLGWPQRIIADVYNIAQPTVSNIKTGAIRPWHV